MTNQALQVNQNVNITTDDSKDQHESSPKHQKTQKTKKSQKRLNNVMTSLTRKKLEKSAADK